MWFFPNWPKHRGHRTHHANADIVVVACHVQLLAMAEELESLGGGDARLGHLTVCIKPALLQHMAHSILTADSNAVHLLDPRAAPNLPLDQRSRTFRLPSCSQDGDWGQELHAKLGQVSLSSMSSSGVLHSPWPLLAYVAACALPTLKRPLSAASRADTQAAA